jgi:hypothetical protein
MEVNTAMPDVLVVGLVISLKDAEFSNQVT